MSSIGIDVVKTMLNNKKFDVVTECATIQHGSERKIIINEYAGKDVRLFKNDNGDVTVLYPKTADVVMEGHVAQAITNGTIFDDADEADNNAEMITRTALPYAAMINSGKNEPNTIKKVVCIVLSKMDDDGRCCVSDADRDNGINFIKDITDTRKNDGDTRDVIDNYIDKPSDEFYGPGVGSKIVQLNKEVDDVNDTPYEEVIDKDTDTVDDYGDYDMNSFEKDNDESVPTIEPDDDDEDVKLTDTDSDDKDDDNDSEDSESDNGSDNGSNTDDDTDELSDDSNDDNSDSSDDDSTDDESDDDSDDEKKKKVVKEFGLFGNNKSDDDTEDVTDTDDDVDDDDESTDENVDIAESLDVDPDGALSEFLSKMNDSEFISKIKDLNERAHTEDIKCNNAKNGNNELGVSFIWTPDEIVEENELNESVDQGYIAFAGTDNPDSSFVIGVEDGKIYIDEVNPENVVYDSFDEFISNIDGFDNVNTDDEESDEESIEEVGDASNTGSNPMTSAVMPGPTATLESKTPDEIDRERYKKYQEGFLTKKPKKLKPIGRDVVAYITVMINDIHSSNDQAMLAGYTCSKLELVDFYITALDTQDARYIVPHTRQYLATIKNDLEILLARILKIRPVNRSEQIWRVNYPTE